MSKTIVVDTLGGPGVMKLVDQDPGAPGPGEVRIRQRAIGVNFADIHYRRGTAPAHAMAKLPMPFTPGLEAVGVIEAVGPGVTAFKPGDRVGYATAKITIGAYAEVRVFPAELVYPVPDTVSDLDAAALMYRAITVHGMIRQCYVVKPGDTVLLHAAAGGIGSILSRWAQHLGATVIGTVSSDAKAEQARASGCAHVIVNGREDFVARTLEITDGRGVDVAYDGVGIDVFLKTFDAIRKYGTMVSFGQASGMMDAVEPVLLQHRGHYLTKFSGSTYNEDTAEYMARAGEVIEAIGQGIFSGGAHATYALADVAQAHEDMESRRSTGSLVLTA
ncbi:MAG: quinone oxidoreductase [Pseudomonadota bacterium]